MESEKRYQVTAKFVITAIDDNDALYEAQECFALGLRPDDLIIEEIKENGN